MRAIWKGAISFGLVNIPVGLFPATQPAKEIKLRLLRSSDQSPIKYKRVAQADEKEVAWEEIVKGYEYEKDKFVVLSETDFQRVRVPSNQTVAIQEFVRLDRIDPMFFDEPYYLVPEKGGEEAYTMLREALRRTKKAGIAKVVIKTREHLAAVKPVDSALVLELMHFADELINPAELSIPPAKELGEKELAMAESLIHDMSAAWEPQKYKDEYREGLMQIIEQRLALGARPALPPKAKARPATKVVDLVSVLQQSIDQAQAGKRKRAPKTPEAA